MPLANLDDDFPQRLAQRLASQPDDACCGERMAPQLTYGRHRGPAPWSARRAAVLLLLVRRAEGWCLPLAVRPESAPHHAGQIGLPGGRLEPGESSWQAAVREFEEEFGVAPECRQLGRLPPCYVFASDFCVTPWVAVTDESPRWIPEPAEVERAIEVPIAKLLDPASMDEMTIERGLLTFRAPCYRVGEDRVWGATAVILGEFAAMMERVA
jgi:8-oxo-dGTP pyrophosphatase MutT (NUDIX family)